MNVKKIFAVAGALLLGLSAAGCRSNITVSDRINLKRTARNAETWLEDKYGTSFTIMDAKFSFSSGLFGNTVYPDTMIFRTSDGTDVLFLDGHFVDNYEHDVIDEELTQYLYEKMEETGYTIIWDAEPVFGSYYAGEQDYSGMYHTKWNGDAEAFLYQEQGNYTLDHILCGLPDTAGTPASKVDMELAEKGPFAFGTEGMDWHEASAETAAVLRQFGNPTFLVTIGFVTEEHLMEGMVRSGDRNCEHVTRIYSSNSLTEQYQDRYYLGHGLFLSGGEDNFQLKEEDIIIREADMTLKNLENLLNEKTFSERPERYTVLELTLSERAKEVIRKKDGMNFFGTYLRGSAGTKVQIVNLERNEIRSTGWNYRPDTANLLYLYEKPVYLVIEE